MSWRTIESDMMLEVDARGNAGMSYTARMEPYASCAEFLRQMPPIDGRSFLPIWMSSSAELSPSSTVEDIERNIRETIDFYKRHFPDGEVFLTGESYRPPRPKLRVETTFIRVPDLS